MPVDVTTSIILPFNFVCTISVLGEYIEVKIKLTREVFL